MYHFVVLGSRNKRKVFLVFRMMVVLVDDRRHRLCGCTAIVRSVSRSNAQLHQGATVTKNERLTA